MLRALLRLFTRRPKAQAPAQTASIFDLTGTAPPVRGTPSTPKAEVRRCVLDIRNRFSSVEHYYHFTLGFLAPLILGPAPRNSAVTYVVRSCGPMDAHLRALALPNLEIIEKPRWLDLVRSAGRAAERIEGFDDPAFYDPAAFARLRLAMLERFGIDGAAPPDGVLFIVRGASPDYYQSEASEVKTSANLRRTVPNLAAIAGGMAARGIKASVAELETMPLREQVALFAAARALVAQHGAALANMLWMPPGSAIIEINPMAEATKFRDYFRHLAAACGHRYAVVDQAGQHAPVDPGQVEAAFAGLGLSGPGPAPAA